MEEMSSPAEKAGRGVSICTEASIAQVADAGGSVFTVSGCYAEVDDRMADK
jgi:hypothetical protein